ncbi:MAG: hypothetical protein LUC93_16440 [Planctomycetaceae bacterium]|nr:hypothetical protein [Planctomycetaceae bacterium]
MALSDTYDARQEFLDERRRNDLTAIAATPEGQRILASLVHDSLALGGVFNGDNTDAYQEGRRHVAVELREELKGVLARDTFIKIICPEEE